jgi:hypothetical protein
MSKRLPRGLVFKSGTYEKGETFYIILKNRFSIPWLNKTATFYKNLEDDSSPLELSKITSYDFRNYLNYYNSGMLKLPDKQEIIRLNEGIEDLPNKTKKRLYGKNKLTLINKLEMSLDDSDDYFNLNPLHNPTIKKISDIDSNLDDSSRNLFSRTDYKKAQ